MEIFVCCTSYHIISSSKLFCLISLPLAFFLHHFICFHILWSVFSIARQSENFEIISYVEMILCSVHIWSECIWVHYGQNVRWFQLKQQHWNLTDQSTNRLCASVFVCECMGMCLSVRNILSTRQNSNCKMQNKHSQKETIRTGKCEQQQQQQKMEQILRHDTNITIRTLAQRPHSQRAWVNIKPHFRPELITLIEAGAKDRPHLSLKWPYSLIYFYSFSLFLFSFYRHIHSCTRTHWPHGVFCLHC